MRLENDELRVHWPEPGEAKLQPNPRAFNSMLRSATFSEPARGTFVPNPFPPTPIKRGTVHPFGGVVMG